MAAKADLSRGPVLLSVSMSTVSLAFATALIRFCVRKRISNNVGIDDYAIAVACLMALIGTIFVIVDSVNMTDSPHALEFDFLGQSWSLMGSTMAKISICLFFLRLVGAVRQWRILLGSQILLIATVNFAVLMTMNLQCRPLEKLWNPAVKGQCWDPNVQLNIGYFQGAFSVFWWLFLSLFPVMIVRDLEMHRRMRWPFYFLSSLSLVAAIFATVRTYETSQTVPGVYTFDTFFSSALAILEQNIGIVAANVLPMGPLFSRRQRAAIRAESRMDRGVGAESGSGSGSGGGGGTSTAGGSKSSNKRSDSGRSSIKRTSLLIIEGPRKVGFEDTDSSRGIILEDDDDGNNSDDAKSIAESVGSDALPRGIIKTVEVEVVEEDIADIERAAAAEGGIGLSGLGARAASRLSTFSGDNDWAGIMRNGRTPPGSRGPSRLA